MPNTNLTTYQRLVDIPNILAAILKITVLGNIVLAIIWSRDGIGVGATAMLSTAGISIVLIWINHKGYLKLAGGIFLITISGIATFLIMREDGFYNVPSIIYPLTIIFSGLVFGRGGIPFTTLLMSFLTIMIYLLEKQGVILPFNGTITLWTGDLIIALVLLNTTGAVLGILMQVVERNLQNIVDSEQALQDVYNQTLIGWAKALELRGREPKGHYQRVINLIDQFSDVLDLDECTREELRRGALLHDIGKMGIPDAVLLKPGTLNEEEFEIIKQHTSMAEQVLANDSYLKETLNIALYHHEQWDGLGYPKGLKGDEIPLSARIFTLIDNWDSMTSTQVYRASMPRKIVLAYIREQAGAKFDEELAILFINMMEGEA